MKLSWGWPDLPTTSRQALAEYHAAGSVTGTRRVAMLFDGWAGRISSEHNSVALLRGMDPAGHEFPNRIMPRDVQGAIRIAPRYAYFEAPSAKGFQGVLAPIRFVSPRHGCTSNPVDKLGLPGSTYSLLSFPLSHLYGYGQDAAIPPRPCFLAAHTAEEQRTDKECPHS